MKKGRAGTALLSVDVLVVDGYPMAVVGGELDGVTGPGLEVVLIGVTDAHPGRGVHVDVADLSFCDSSGLAVLVEVHRRASSIGGRLVLISPQPHLTRPLTLTGLHQVFEIHYSAPGS